MKTSQIIDRAFEQCLGDVQVGNVVTHKSHRLAFNLYDIIDGIGYCSIPGGERKQWPISELANTNKVKNLAVELAIKDALSPSRLN